MKKSPERGDAENRPAGDNGGECRTLLYGEAIYRFQSGPAEGACRKSPPYVDALRVVLRLTERSDFGNLCTVNNKIS